MLNKRIINTGGDAACTTDTTQILDAGTTESLALYRFEDNAFDTSNSTGYINKGAIFNGSSSKINLAAGSFTYTSQFSITAWIKLKSTQANQTILENYEYLSSTSRGFNFKVHTGDKLKFDGYYSDATRTDALSSTSIPLNTWTHVAAVYDSTSSSIKLYINGSEVSYTTQTYNAMQYHSNCAVNIGALTYGGGAGTNDQQWFNGHIDELRVYDDALTATEIGYIANNTTASIPTGNLAALYSFEGNANDSTSYPINGTASNIVYDYDGTANNITYSTGKFGKAAVFNGSSTGIEIPGLSTMFGQKTSYTVSAWFKAPSSATGNRAIFDDYNYANSNLGLYLYDGVMNFFARYNNSNTSGIYSGTVTYNDNNWHHVVATSDQTTGKLYIDGELISSGAMPSPSYSGGSPVVSIGKQQHPGSSTYSWFDGSIDQYRIFDHAITPAQVTALYNETATSVASGTIDNPSTIAYYKMADASDETGSYDGTATNVDFNVIGKYGFAGLFNGSNSYIDISTLDFPTNNFSVSAWVYLNSTPGSTTYNMILTTAKQNSGGYFYFTFYGTQLQYYHVASSTSVIGGTVVAGQWNHVVLTQSSTGGAKVYLNDSVVASNTSLTANNTPNTTSGGVNTLGYYNTGSSTTGSLNGRMDQVRIFNKAISAAEVTTLYNEVQCANTITTPESYFNTVLFTPTTSTSALPVTGVGFSPGLAWAKYRGTGSGASTQSHYLVDTVRGITSRIFSNSTGQGTNDNYVQSFDSDGITYVNNLFNRTGANSVVGWFWKAASSDTTNNDGSITSTVRASQESGFSIVKYTGTGANATVGHGLNKPPSLIIVKPYGRAGDNWSVFNSISPNTQATFLNLNGTSQTPSSWGYGSGTFWNNTSPTSSVFSLGTIADTNASGINIIAYCFANIDGYQRIGSYAGNGSSNGPFVYTGFEPAWLLIKRLDGGNSSWAIHDNKRVTSNPRNKELFANLSDAESTFTAVDFLDNGFQIVNSNALYNNNGNTYLFLAIAANPDTTAPTKANSFKTVLYTGDDGTSRQLTGMGFKPDFTWIKQRNAVDNHALFDSVRGVNLSLSSNLVNVTNDRNDDSTKGVTSFDNDGVTLGSWNNVNANNDTYVAWNWKGLDHDRNLPAVNNDGSIISSVSANIAAGFSIVSYKGNATSGATVGHGLGAELDLLIVKSPNLTQAWNVYVKGVTTTNAQYFRLNESNSIYSTSNPRFIPANFNSNVFSIGSDNACNGNNDDYIAYCFKSISGYSKIGTYTISSSSDRVITGLGFTPSWVMVKRTDSTGSWVITDTSRLITKEIYADLSNAENTDSNGVQSFDSDGFTVGTGSWLGASGGTYIYMAFK